MKYIITGTYATESGNVGTFRYLIEAQTFMAAIDKAKGRVKEDKRKKYAGKLSISATLDWESKQ